jgi:DNA-directed RNA polymerase subunit RPC12/RpoP
MKCAGCGAEVPSGANACPACGRPVIMPPPPPTTDSSRVTNPIRKVASTTVEATKSVASEVKKTGKAAMGEARIAVQDVSTLTRQAVDEVGKGLESVGKELQKARKKGK